MNSLGSKLALALAMVCLATSASTTVAKDWGTLKGKFIYKGDLKPKDVDVNKDAEYCSKHELKDEEVVLGKGNALQNVFIYLYVKRGKSVDIHPDYESAEVKPVILDNHGCRFEPHALALWTKQPLEVRNSDEGIGHNTNAALRRNPKFNQQISNGQPLTVKFEKSEPAPAPLACNVHPWMKSYVLIRDNPYAAVTNEKGEFEIKNLPAGKHEFIIWHEAPGSISKLEVGGEKTDRKGRVDLTIPAGKTLDLGEVIVTPKLLDQ